MSAVKYEGDYGFEEFLENGGASSDEDVVKYLSGVLSGADGFSFGNMPFGCSTVSVKSENGGYLFGRNFDWNRCNALIIHSMPQNGYSSISTVNTDFINMSGMKLNALPDNVQAIIAMYAPLDGMNEKGLAVSVNMIQDSATISQNTDKPDITTTTAIRLLLNKAANVDEALKLLRENIFVRGCAYEKNPFDYLGGSNGFCNSLQRFGRQRRGFNADNKFGYIAR